MASSAVNVTNPVSNPTALQLSQIAANIAGTLARNSQTGNYEDVYDAITDLAAAINCLAQANITLLGSGSYSNAATSSVTTVNTRNAYALGATATIPTFIGTAAV
jgi:hypothetical protein